MRAPSEVCLFTKDGGQHYLPESEFTSRLRFIGKRKCGHLIGRTELAPILAGVVRHITGKELTSPGFLIDSLEFSGAFFRNPDATRFAAFVEGFIEREPGAQVTGEELHRVWKSVFGHRQCYSASDLLWALRDDHGFELNAQWGRTVLNARLK